MGTKIKFCMAKIQFEVIGPLAKDFGGQQQVDSDSFFGGGCEIQALLQHPDAALKIELDGNNLGSGALILAFALKICQASEQTKMD